MRDRFLEAISQTVAMQLLERETLPAYLTKRRWFSAKGQSLSSVRIAYAVRLPGNSREIVLSEIETVTDGVTNRWLLPMSTIWEDEPQAALPSQLALSRVRRGRRIGLLTDAFTLQEFGQQMLCALADRQSVETPEGRIVFEPAAATTDALRCKADAAVLWLTAEQSNSSMIVDDAVMLKIFRRVAPGAHPEAEMGRYLTAHGFTNSPLMLGEVRRIDEDGNSRSLAVAQSFVRNQGDGWSWTLDQFKRALVDFATHGEAPQARRDDIEDYLAFAGMVGMRLAQMHALLAQPTEDEAFAPAKATAGDVAGWIAEAEARLDAAFDAIAQRKSGESPADDAAPRRSRQVHAERRRQRRLSYSWRFPSRPDPGGNRRRLHHRLRGRARSAPGGTTGQDEPASRRGGLPSIARLRRCHHARSHEAGRGAAAGERARRLRVAAA